MLLWDSLSRYDKSEEHKPYGGAKTIDHTVAVGNLRQLSEIPLPGLDKMKINAKCYTTR